MPPRGRGKSDRRSSEELADRAPASFLSSCPSRVLHVLFHLRQKLRHRKGWLKIWCPSVDFVERQMIRHIWSAKLRSHYFRRSDPGCHFTRKGDPRSHGRIRRPGSMADDDCPVRRSHQVHRGSAFSTQPKVLDSTFRMISFRSRVLNVCLNHEDLSTSKMVERYVADWISTRSYHDPPWRHTGRRHARFAEVLTQSDERNESGQWSQARSIAIEHDFREGVFSGVAYPEFLASGIPCKKCSVCLDS